MNLSIWILPGITENSIQNGIKSARYCPRWVIGFSENLRIFLPVPDFSNFGSRPRTKKKNENGRDKTRATKEYDMMMFYSYSKRMWGLRVLRCDNVDVVECQPSNG